MPGTKPEREPAEDEQDRVRDPDSLGDDDQRCRRDEQDEKDEAVFGGEHSTGVERKCGREDSNLQGLAPNGT